MKGTWNVRVTAQEGAYAVICSPTAFGGGVAVGGTFNAPADLTEFLDALQVGKDEIATTLRACAEAGPGQKGYTIRNVALSDEGVARYKLHPV
jgi:hypothetical protein